MIGEQAATIGGYRTFDTYDAGHGRLLAAGTELTVEGIRGRVRFVQHVVAPSGAHWLDVITVRAGRSRSIRPAAVRTVHRRPGRG
jgi:hypothetical protein